jgi:hypothetical protein
MKKILTTGLLMLACAGLNASAQDWYHDREERFREEQWRAHLFNHIRVDLDHVQSVTWPGGHDRYRIDKTKFELNELQGKLEHHIYDERELNGVIGSLDKVVLDNHMGPREREILNDDLNRLRDYRAHHEHWIR